MDVNETIVGTWLEAKGFFVRQRLKYDLSGAKDWSSVSDVDLLGYNPNGATRVAALVTAWMTQSITPSHIKTGGVLSHALRNFLGPEATSEIKKVFDVSDEKDFQRWWVVGRLGSRTRSDVQATCQSLGIVRVIEFREVVTDLVQFVKDDAKYLPHESEALQIIRALVWNGLL